jgi:hypothetical protein
MYITSAAPQGCCVLRRTLLCCSAAWTPRGPCISCGMNCAPTCIAVVIVLCQAKDVAIQRVALCVHRRLAPATRLQHTQSFK